MASHVVVLDSSFRRAKVNVTPGTYLSDVLEEACKKLSLKSSNYGLKNNNKQLDLSLTIRQTNLSSGAKLELVIASRTPTVVSVALQLPQSLASSAPNGRLTDKFPSDTTLWLILRKFESGEGRNFNFTARGNAQISIGESGAGRVFFEQPVLNIMGRQFASIADLQKTLGQLGLNGGSAMMRLEFQTTDKPLEEAMKEISQYFREDEQVKTQEGSNSALKGNDTITDAIAKLPSEEAGSENVNATSLSESNPASLDPSQPTPLSPAKRKTPSQEEESSIQQDASGRPILVYRPPSSSTPKAALTPHNEADYEPTIAHAKLHQSRLMTSTMNKRLPSEAEIAAAEKEKAEKMAATKEVTVKIRFPDQSTVVSTFTKDDTGEELHKFVSRCILAEQEPFKLVWNGKGPQTVPKGEKKLIKDLGFEGKMLVNFSWDDSASDAARVGPILKKEYEAKAQEVVVPVVAGGEAEEGAASADKGKEKEGEGKPGGKGKGLSAFMKGLRKK